MLNRLASLADHRARFVVIAAVLSPSPPAPSAATSPTA